MEANAALHTIVRREDGRTYREMRYHSRALLKSLDGGVWRTCIAEPKQPSFSR